MLKKGDPMKRALVLSLLIISILAPLFSNDFQGKVYKVKSGPSQYKNQEWQFTDNVLFISDTKEGKYTAYDYVVSGSTISLQGPISSTLEDILTSSRLSYSLSEGTAGLQLDMEGVVLKLFDTGRESDRKALASSIADKSVGLAGMVACGVTGVKASKAVKTDKFTQTLEYARANGGKAQDGYVGNRFFANREGKLPTADSSGRPITYKEYDVNRYVPGVDRGAERIVIGSNGSAYKTVDHYQTFEMMAR